MTTESVAEDAVSRMMALRQGKGVAETYVAGESEPPWKYFHLAASGPAKVGKTHLALSSMTHEIRKPDEVGEKFEKIPGEILIPSKPLSVAVANFDRPTDTVRDNLPEGANFYEEHFFKDVSGGEYHPLALTDADFDQLFLRLDEFIRQAIAADFDLCFVDGGTITWEFIRRWRLPTPSEPGKGNAPREYAAANLSMRTWIQRLYSSQIHSIVSMEAREKWSSARGADEDAAGNAVLIPDGWRRTQHYSDMLAQLYVKDRRSGDGSLVPTRLGVIYDSLKVENQGREVVAPTFSKLFGLNYGRPLVLKADWEDYVELQREHDWKLSWS